MRRLPTAFTAAFTASAAIAVAVLLGGIDTMSGSTEDTTFAASLGPDGTRMVQPCGCAICAGAALPLGGVVPMGVPLPHGGGTSIGLA